MEAGDAAGEQSRLAAERVARLQRQFGQAERGTDSWGGDDWAGSVVAGKLGELVPHGWHVLHDIHWPGRPKAWLDHVLIGPGGVVVVADKNWTGEVRVASGVLWQGRYARTQAVEGALAQCAAVASVVAPRHRRLVRPLICMAAQPDVFGVTSSDVAVAGWGRVVGAIEALPPVLDQQTVTDLYADLGQELMREQVAGVTAFRTGARPGTAIPPAPPVRPARDGSPPQRSAAAPRPAVPPAARSTAPSGFHARSVKSHSGGTSVGRLALLAAFVIFAVYVLPYWTP